MGSMDSEVERILRRVGATYAECASYRDTGEVRTRSRDTEPLFGPDGQLMGFHAAFDRAVGFRFEYRDQPVEEGLARALGVTDIDCEWSRYVIWSEGIQVFSWWSINPVKTEHDHPGSALHAAAGVSSGLSSMVPYLLLGSDEAGPSTLCSFSSAERVQFVELDERPCHHLHAQPEGGNHDLELWIDAESALIRRIRDHHRMSAEEVRAQHDESVKYMQGLGHSPPESLEAAMQEAGAELALDLVTTTSYSPQIDVELAADELAFEPPS